MHFFIPSKTPYINIYIFLHEQLTTKNHIMSDHFDVKLTTLFFFNITFACIIIYNTLNPTTITDFVRCAALPAACIFSVYTKLFRIFMNDDDTYKLTYTQDSTHLCIRSIIHANTLHAHYYSAKS